MSTETFANALGARKKAGGSTVRRSAQLHRRTCLVCGTLLQQLRSTKLFCGDRCRKAAKRASAHDGDATELQIRDQLIARNLIGQIWPVYRWDQSPRVFGLLVPRARAAAELAVSDDELVRVLRRFGIMEGRVEEGLIHKFRADREGRRVERDEVLSRTEPVVGPRQRRYLA
jgi:hypothetical protein